MEIAAFKKLVARETPPPALPLGEREADRKPT
jgi:hypothetical protein